MTESKIPATTLRRAADLAIAEIYARDGLETAVEFIEIVAEGPPAGPIYNVERALRRLHEEGCIGVIGLANSDSCMAVADLIDELKLPALAAGSSAAYSSAYTFSVQWGSCPEEAFLMIDWLAQHGARRIGIVWDMLWHSGEWVHYMRLACRRWGLTIVSEERVPSPTTPHSTAPVERSLRLTRAALERMRDAKPDALALLPAMAAPAVVQCLADMKWSPPYVGNCGFAVHRLAPELIQGVTFVSLYDEDNPTAARFMARYVEEFGASPDVVHQALTHYDQARAFFEGLSLAPIWSREGLRQGLEQVKLLPSAQGARGTYINFSPWDHRGVKGASAMVLRQVRSSENVQANGSAVVGRYQGLYRESV
jgi:ABC-type branched-subunit amino acid transport system substrate-binding protein